MAEPRPSGPIGPGSATPEGTPRPEAGARPQVRPRPDARPRPDPRPMRLMAGFVGLASLSAIATGLLPGVLPSASGGAAWSTTTTAVTEATPQPVQHVTRYVQLRPGQTAPPQA